MLCNTDIGPRIVDLERRAVVAEHRWTSVSINSVAAAPAGFILGTATNAALWDGRGAAMAEDLWQESGPFQVVATADGRRLVMAQPTKVRVWTERESDRARSIPSEAEPTHVAYAANGRRLVFTGLTGVTTLVDLVPRGQPRTTALARTSGDVATDAAISPDGSRVVVVGPDRVVRLFDADTHVVGERPSNGRARVTRGRPRHGGGSAVGCRRPGAPGAVPPGGPDGGDERRGSLQPHAPRRGTVTSAAPHEPRPDATGDAHPRRGATTAAVLLGTFLAALEYSIVGTAMPTIIGALGGMHIYAWVFSAYLLTSTTSVPLFGKLGDLIGRKPVYIIGVVLFMLGSVLCGLSQSMTQLIAFRALQGIGAGAVQPMTMTIIGDIWPLAQRGRMQGWFSAVWGTSGLVGPAVGAALVATVGWRWVFFLNVPFGIASVALLGWAFRERHRPVRRSVDYAGAGLLTAGIAILLYAILFPGGSRLVVFALYAAGAAALLLFLRVERTAEEPVLPLGLFGRREIACSSLSGAMSGGILFGAITFVPLFVQGVQGGTAAAAGAVLAPMALGWPLGSIVAGRLLVRVGYRPLILTGMAFLVAGSAWLLRLEPTTSRPEIIAAVVLIGLGMGLQVTSYLIAVQSAVPWGLRGVATASTQFFRTLGGAVIVAALGAVLNARLAPVAAGLGAGLHLPEGRRLTDALLDPKVRATLSDPVVQALRGALADGLSPVFVTIAVLAVGALVASLAFPRGRASEAPDFPAA